MKRESNLYLKDILKAINNIQEYSKNLDKNKLANNNLVLDAVLRNLEIIGEAISNVPEEIKNQYPEVEWKRIKGFRNVVAHKY